MFLCDNCHDPAAHPLDRKSYGPCEGCGKARACIDCHISEEEGACRVSEHTIKIVDGVATFVYSDDLVDLTKQGETTITRASHVEPANTIVGWCVECHAFASRRSTCPCCGVDIPNKALSGWVADMRPSGGLVLAQPNRAGFETREEALQAERNWLRKEKGL